nr:DREB2 transcription factor [Tanacetum cinerariifolium]
MAAQTSYTLAEISNLDIIVSPRFLTSYSVDLTITRKVVSLSLGNFSVTDVNGNVMFKVIAKEISLHGRCSLLDAADNPILSDHLMCSWVVMEKMCATTKSKAAGVPNHAPSMPERAPQSFLSDMNCLFPLSESWCLVTYESTLRTSTPVTRFNSTLKNHISHPHCEALKRAAEQGQASMSRDESFFVYNLDVLHEQFVGLVIQRGLPFNHFDDEQTTRVFQKHLQPKYNHCKQDKSTFETPVDFEEEILDAEVQANEAILLSDEEIPLDAASSEGSMSRPDSEREEAEAERIELGAIGLDYNGISRSKFFNHSSSLPAAARATNSYSIIEPVIQVCFLEAQEITPPPSMNTQPLVDVLSLMLLIQLASVPTCYLEETITIDSLTKKQKRKRTDGSKILAETHSKWNKINKDAKAKTRKPPAKGSTKGYMYGKGGPENRRPIYGPVTRINLPNYCLNASLTASSCDSTVACSQSESNEVRESKTAQNNVCEAIKSEVDITGISNDDMLDIDEFLGVMGEYECSQAQGLKTTQNNVSEATAKEVEVTGIPDKNFFDIDELLGNINQKGQYDAWFENNVDGFDFDFLDTKFEDYIFTLEELGISLDPAKPVM